MIVCFHIPHIAIATERSRVAELWGAPLAIVAENGLIQVVSDEACRFGIQVGQQSSGARALCAQLRMLPYERALYEQAAALIWDGIAVETSIVEPVSPELCYAELDDRHVPPRLKPLVCGLSYAAKIEIFAGLATTKLVAKTAAFRAEAHEPLNIIFPGSERHILADVSIESLGIIDGPLLRRLTKLGLGTLGDLQAVSFRDLQRVAGKQALHLSRLAIGLDSDPVLPTWPRPSLTARQGFDYDVNDVDSVLEGLRRCARNLNLQLERRREFASRLTLSLVREDSSEVTDSERLESPTQSAAGLYTVAARILHRLDALLDRPLVAVGVEAAELSIASGSQLTLIDVHGNKLPGETAARLKTLVRKVRHRYGISAVMMADTLHRARRIDCWTSPLCRHLSESVEVVAGEDGTPKSFWRKSCLYQVSIIERAWRESSWHANDLLEERIYRVETEPTGVFELHHIGSSWRLTAAQD